MPSTPSATARGLLSEVPLNGVHGALVEVRPTRYAILFEPSFTDSLNELVAQECSFWGGGSTPLIPLSPEGRVGSDYEDILSGSAIDLLRIEAMNADRSQITRFGIPIHEAERSWRRQPVMTLLPYGESERSRPLRSTHLSDPDDPWAPIYAACLGVAEVKQFQESLGTGNFRGDLKIEDFVRLEHETTEGSLHDLCQRLLDREVMSPRTFSRLFLAAGGTCSSAIRDSTVVLPAPGLTRLDAGPNIVVVCERSSLDDFTLLWNLRGAHGDNFVAPLGIPCEDFNDASIRYLIESGGLCRSGMPLTQIYVTSYGVSLDRLKRVTDRFSSRMVEVVTPAAVLTLGRAPARPRSELLTWNDGQTALVAGVEHGESIRDNLGLSPHADIRMNISCFDSPLPGWKSHRQRDITRSIFDSTMTIECNIRSLRPTPVAWPASMELARWTALSRGIRLRESAAGRASISALRSLGSLEHVSYLLHGPLLNLLESLSGWNTATDRGVAPRQGNFGNFLRALGNNSTAATGWLLWAERKGIVLKGFRIGCEACGMKSWISVSAFSSPLSCQGCDTVSRTPFGDRTKVNFEYGLSERWKSLFRLGAVGHLLVMHFMDKALGVGESGRLVGMHPGIDLLAENEEVPLGEVDLLLLTRDGDLVPIEVKSSAHRVTEQEVAKLDQVCEALRSPWSGFAVCEYLKAVEEDLSRLEQRDSYGARTRLALSYDRLLDPHPFWSMGCDPFQLSELDHDEITKREGNFLDYAGNPL